MVAAPWRGVRHRVMTEREYEEQPEAPDLGASAQLETGESLVGPPGKDALDASYVPPDRPFGLDDEETTAAAMREPETLDHRLRRERPDVGADVAAGEPAPEQGEVVDSVAGAERSGRLAPAADTVIEGTGSDPVVESTDAVDVGISGGAASAEEAAVHELDEGPPVTDDDLHDEEPAGISLDPEPGP